MSICQQGDCVPLTTQKSARQLNCAKWAITAHIFLLFSTFEYSKVSSMENGILDVTTDRLESKAIEVAATLSALANPKRLVVLCNLLAGEKSVGELAEIVQLTQGALSQHLGKMRALRLVATRRDGQTIYYSLASAEVQAVLETLYKVYCAPDC